LKALSRKLNEKVATFNSLIFTFVRHRDISTTPTKHTYYVKTSSNWNVTTRV